MKVSDYPLTLCFLFTFLLSCQGPGVKENYEFKATVELTDMLPTATRVLGLKQSPWWRGKVMEEAFDTEALYPESECEQTSGASHTSVKIKINFVILFVLISLINLFTA